MIEQHIIRMFKQHGTGRGTAVCLGDQIPTTGETAAKLFAGLGYDSFYDIDYNGRAVVNHDLNNPLPSGLKQADLLYDGGVIEHVCNISEALRSIASLVKVGGVLVQVNPVNTYGESYYCLDPQLPRDFYEANGFVTKELFLFHRPSLRWWAVAMADRYMPPSLNRKLRDKLRPSKKLQEFVFVDSPIKTLSYGKKYVSLPRRTGLMYVGVKVREVSPIVWPHQRYYPAA